MWFVDYSFNSCCGTDIGSISWCQSFHQVGCEFGVLANICTSIPWECIADYLYCLTKVLQRLEEAGLTLNREKCQFLQSQVKFLGQVVDRNGICPDPEKVAAIQNVKSPNNVGDIRQFLGMVILLQKQPDELKPIAYISRSLTPTEQHHAQIEKEALAFTWACERFSDIFLGLRSESIQITSH